MPAIRIADLNDLHLIQDLAQKIWPDAYGKILSTEQIDYMLNKIYSIASLQNQLIDLKHNFILVFDNNSVTGFASFSVSEKNSLTFRLHKIYILPDQKGKGIGKFILEQVITIVKKSGGTSLELNVNRYNKALHFYKKQGFKTIREEDIDIGQGFFMNDYVMEKKL